MSNRKQIIEFKKNSGEQPWVSVDEAVFQINDANNHLEHAMFIDEKKLEGSMVASVSLDPSGMVLTLIRLWNETSWNDYSQMVSGSDIDQQIVTDIQNTCGVEITQTDEESPFGP